jgi:hypothetical protein
MCPGAVQAATCARQTSGDQAVRKWLDVVSKSQEQQGHGAGPRPAYRPQQGWRPRPPGKMPLPQMHPLLDLAGRHPGVWATHAAAATRPAAAACRQQGQCWRQGLQTQVLAWVVAAELTGATSSLSLRPVRPGPGRQACGAVLHLLMSPSTSVQIDQPAASHRWVP